MRVSTSQIFASGSRGIGSNQFDLFKLQNQISSGRKNLSAEDDPVAVSQALIVTQSQSVSVQFQKNQQDAQGKLGVLDSQLTAMEDLMQSVRGQVVQAGGGVLTNADRSSITQELEARFSELVGIANADDGVGNYLFSGYEGATKPFAANATGAEYLGDDGQRLVQVSGSKQMATNISGSDLFNNIRNGNGTFVTLAGDSNGVKNRGAGVIDQGSVSNPALWNQALDAGYKNIEIQFTVSGAGKAQYQLFDNSSPPTPPSALSSTPMDFTSGQSIPLNVRDATGVVVQDFGASVVISGQPASGDKFVITPSANESIFTTLRNTINTLTRGVSSVAGSSTQFENDLASNLQNIDQAMARMTEARTKVGSYMNELSSLGAATDDLQLQYETSLSNLQELDYTKAATDLSQKKLQLEASQLSFKQTSQLSLFSIL